MSMDHGRYKHIIERYKKFNENEEGTIFFGWSNFKMLHGHFGLKNLSEFSDIISMNSRILVTPPSIVAIDETTTDYNPSIEKMKDGVMLINTSRGGLVNTKDVIKGLKKGKIGYLGLDVYEEESKLFFQDHSEDILQDDVISRLLTFKNVLITSHQAFLTDTALKNIADTTIYNLDCWQENMPSPNELGR